MKQRATRSKPNGLDVVLTRTLLDQGRALTQLAEKLPVSVSALSRYKNGNRTIPHDMLACLIEELDAPDLGEEACGMCPVKLAMERYRKVVH